MFPLEQNHDALIFDDLSAIGHDNLLEELLAGHDVETPNIEVNNVDQCSKTKRKRKLQVNVDGQATKGVEGSNELKKVMHREIERQRRKEMSTLFASLRALLPVEYIKGKRSTTEHMNEAVKYIKHLQKRSQAMQNRRDELMNVSSSSSRGAEGVTVNESTSLVMLNPFGDEIEILISTDIQPFPLSKVLLELLGRGLDVLSCVSSKANERTLQKIQIKVNDSSSIDIVELQNHLANLIKLARSLDF